MKMNIKKVLLLTFSLGAMLSQAFANNFPVTVEHKFGTTVIEKQPQRVVSLDYNGQDNLLSLGVQPLAIREKHKDGQIVGPWSQDLVKNEPIALGYEYDIEQIASLKPDIIIALYSGIKDKDYNKLSKIAPVIAVPKGVDDWAMPWDSKAILTGKVIGKEAEATKKVNDIRELIKSIADKHPEWKGKSLAVAKVHSDSELGIYANGDVRMRFFENFGFIVPPEIKKLGDKFTIGFSAERIDLLDVDLVVWYPFTEEQMANGFALLKSVPGHKMLKVYKEERELYLSDDLRGGLMSASLTSLPYVIERLVPRLEKALVKK